MTGCTGPYRVSPAFSVTLSGGVFAANRRTHLCRFEPEIHSSRDRCCTKCHGVAVRFRRPTQQLALCRGRPIGRSLPALSLWAAWPAAEAMFFRARWARCCSVGSAKPGLCCVPPVWPGASPITAAVLARALPADREIRCQARGTGSGCDSPRSGHTGGTRHPRADRASASSRNPEPQPLRAAPVSGHRTMRSPRVLGVNGSVSVTHDIPVSWAISSRSRPFD